MDRFIGLAPLTPYENYSDAWQDSLDDARKLTEQDHKEHGGVIYRDSNGKYLYTIPNTGGLDKVNVGVCPANTTEVGICHSHVKDERYDYEKFSPKDKTLAEHDGVNSFLATPTQMKVYVPNGNPQKWKRLSFPV